MINCNARWAVGTVLPDAEVSAEFVHCILHWQDRAPELVPDDRAEPPGNGGFGRAETPRGPVRGASLKNFAAGRDMVPPVGLGGARWNRWAQKWTLAE